MKHMEYQGCTFRTFKFVWRFILTRWGQFYITLQLQSKFGLNIVNNFKLNT